MDKYILTLKFRIYTSMRLLHKSKARLYNDISVVIGKIVAQLTHIKTT